MVRAFAFEGRPVRVELFDGEPWWVVKDVAQVLGYAESSDPNKLVQAVPEEWKGRKRIPTLGGVQEMSCLSEQGLYFFLARSDKPAADPFQRWIAGEVIPSIRKTGKYSMIPADPTLMGLPDFRDPRKSALAWVEQLERADTAEAAVKQLQAQAIQDAPRVALGALIENAPETILVGDMANVVQAHTGIQIGQSGLFEWLRMCRLIMRAKGRHLLPTKRAIDRGLLTVRHTTWDDATGRIHVARSTGVTTKGQGFILSAFAAMNAMDMIASGEVKDILKAEDELQIDLVLLDGRPRGNA
jgi:anti-repressor protein